MDLNKLNEDMCAIIVLKSELKLMDYSDSNYDDQEEKLHDLEDSFLEKYGDYLEDALHEVHDEYCPDNEVLLPIAYLPVEFTSMNGTAAIGNDQGVYVDVDDYDVAEIKLAMVPNPLRLILNIGSDQQEIVWQAEA